VKLAQPLAERHLRLRVEIDEHVIFPHLGMHRDQAVLLRVEVGKLRLVGEADQAAIGRVGPAVKAAGQRLAAAGVMLDQPRAAMAADVVEGAHPAVGAARDHERGFQRRHLGHHVAVLVRQVGRARHRQPRAPEDVFDLAGEEAGLQPLQDIDARLQPAEVAEELGLRDFVHGDLELDASQNGGIDPWALA
jgi:hypothetical protein